MAKRKPFPKGYLKSECQICGSRLALELDHWDNDTSNNAESNARTLCHACHKLKTQWVQDVGIAWANESDNEGFLESVNGAKAVSGIEEFRRLQNKINEEHLEARRHGESKLKDQIIEVTVYRCTKPRFPHIIEIRSDESYDNFPNCIFCPYASGSHLIAVRKHSIRRQYHPGKGWTETIFDRQMIQERIDMRKLGEDIIDFAVRESINALMKPKRKMQHRGRRNRPLP